MKFAFLAHSITAIATIFAPLLTTEFIMPYIFHPYKFGYIPFEKPSTLLYLSVYLAVIVSIVGLFASISGMMVTAKECHKIELGSSMVEAKWAMLFAIIGLTVLFFIPFIKAPLLVIMSPIPFSNLLVTGIVLSFFVVFGHFIGHNYLLRDVCNQ